MPPTRSTKDDIRACSVTKWRQGLRSTFIRCETRTRVVSHLKPIFTNEVKPNYRTAPLIFKVLNQTWPYRSTNITHLPQLLRSAGHFVQYLMTDVRTSGLWNILFSCPNLRNVVINLPSHWREAEMNKLLHVLQDTQRLTRLTVGIPCLSYADIRIRPCFFFPISHIWKYAYHLEIVVPVPGRTATFSPNSQS